MPRRPHSASGTSEAFQRKTQKYGHSVPKGRSLIERIEAQMDKRRKTMEDLVVKYGINWTLEPEWNLQRGRYEGLAAALAILRTSSVQSEIMRSNERLGIE